MCDGDRESKKMRIMTNKNLLLSLVALSSVVMPSMACTGISLLAKDGSYVQARTIEAAEMALESNYVIIPRGYEITSFTPSGRNGLT